MLKAQFADNYIGQVRQTLVHILLWCLFVIISACLSGNVFIIPGLLTGMAASVIYFLLMCNRVKKSSDLSVAKAVSSMRVGWLIRFSFIISILVLSVKVPAIDFWAAVVGLFSLQIVLMLNAVCIVVSGLITRFSQLKK